MAFDLSTLKTSLRAAFIAARDDDDPANQTTIINKLADDIGDAIDVYAKTGNATGSDAPSGDTHNLTLS